MCIAPTQAAVTPGERRARGVQFAMASLGASQGNPGAIRALDQLKATFRAAHGGQTVKQVRAAKMAAGQPGAGMPQQQGQTTGGSGGPAGGVPSTFTGRSGNVYSLEGNNNPARFFHTLGQRLRAGG